MGQGREGGGGVCILAGVAVSTAGEGTEDRAWVGTLGRGIRYTWPSVRSPTRTRRPHTNPTGLQELNLVLKDALVASTQVGGCACACACACVAAARRNMLLPCCCSCPCPRILGYRTVGLGSSTRRPLRTAYGWATMPSLLGPVPLSSGKCLPPHDLHPPTPVPHCFHLTTPPTPIPHPPSPIPIPPIPTPPPACFSTRPSTPNACSCRASGGRRTPPSSTRWVRIYRRPTA